MPIDPKGAAARLARPAAALKVLSASLALFTAAWLIPATIHIVSWGNNGGVGRVALFAPAFYLRWTFGGALLVSLALWFIGPRDDAGRGRRASMVAPLSAFWMWGVPFLPWLPDRLPLLLVLSGPLRWLIAAGATAAVLARMASSREWRAPSFPQFGRRTVFVLSLAIYLLAGTRSLHLVGIGGDEPHYLVIAQSLLLDHDLQIENNHQRGDYRRYFGGPLRPDYLTRGLNEQIYSIHAPGLPVLLMPGFAAAGAWGAVATMALFGAFAALAVFDLAVLVGGARAAWPTWASVCLTVPFVPHAWAIFPEMAGAAVVAWALVWTVRPGTSSASAWLWRGLCLATLPWLHTKFAVLLPVLGLALAIRARTRVAYLAALAAPVALSMVAWFAFFYIIYGTLDPQAPYGDHAMQFVRFENVPRGLAGALFDQKFGLFLYAPVFMASIWGAGLLLRERQWRALGVVTLGLACVYALSSARYYMWWGGSSAPARFLVPVAPLLAPSLAAVFGRIRGGVVAAHVWCALAVSLFVSAISVTDPATSILFSSPHGVARLAEMFRGGSPLTTALPTFTEENWVAPLARLALWLVAAGAASAWAWFARRRARDVQRASVFWALLVELTVFVAVAAIVVGPGGADARAEAVGHGHMGMLTEFDPDGRRAFDYRQRTLGKMTAPQWLGVAGLTFRLDPSESPDPQGRITEGLSLPPGEYDVSVYFRDGVPRSGDLLLTIDGGQVLVRAPAAVGSRVTARFSVPVELPRLWVRMSDAPSAAAVSRVDVLPLAVRPRSLRDGRTGRVVEAVAGRPGAYVSYMNDAAYPEGGVFWTRGTEEAEVLIAAAGAERVSLTIFLGPLAGRVSVDADGHTSEFELGPNETRLVPLTVPSDRGYVSLRVRSSSRFRPADIDPQSSDHRLLGCQVRVDVNN